MAMLSNASVKEFQQSKHANGTCVAHAAVIMYFVLLIRELTSTTFDCCIEVAFSLAKTFNQVVLKDPGKRLLLIILRSSGKRF